MAAPKGNQYWKLADQSKIGKPRNFPTPNDLWAAAQTYFEWCDDNPIKREVATGTQSNPVVLVSHTRPYTYQGLFAFLGICNLEYYKTLKEYSEIITHIDNCIYAQKFEGAAVGMFNANIIAKSLGLTEKQETKITSDKPLVITLTESEADEQTD